MTVIEYFRDWLNVPWLWDAAKKIHGLWKTLTDTLQNRQDELELARTLRFPRFADGEALRRHGGARGIWPVTGETEEQYRARVIAAHATWRAAGTVPGMVEALEFLGYASAVVEEPRYAPLHDRTWIRDRLIDRSGTAWALFDIRLYLADESGLPDADGWRRLLNIIRQIKPARSKLHRVHFYVAGDPPQYLRTIYGRMGRQIVYRDGTYDHDGGWDRPDDLTP